MNARLAALTVEDADFREKIMPIDQCLSPEGLLDESAQGKLAEEITRRRNFSSRCGRTQRKTRWRPDRSSRPSARNSSGLL